MSTFCRLLIVSLLLVALFVSGCSDLFEDESPEGIELVDEVWKLIHDDYVDSDQLDDQELAEAAIKGLIEAIGDPHTSYLSPQQSEISRIDLEGEFIGIGATITIREGRLSVVAPIAGSPAEQAGIRPGDKILEIDGESTEGMSLTDALLALRGDEGAKVNLLVLHVDDDDPVDIVATRAKIEIPSVVLEILPEDFAHISVTNFSGRTGSELESAIEEVSSQGASGIVLDLRNNPGGLVSAAVDVVSQFMDDGVVVYALDNEGDRSEWSVDEGGLALDTHLVVLVNAYSASVSEVVAGALQDYDRGIIIGTTTYGKGSMQHVQDLTNGGMLRVTFARWFTPNGRQIDDKGIVPDIEVEITADDFANDRDPQLERAVEYLSGM
ncbi:MAG: S41 family peptidase [Chloroflexi bacterium]|jgi:carboxyl-terminal processing protease|nr:S41 family peptidase [Chloroflexota bacterium]